MKLIVKILFFYFILKVSSKTIPLKDGQKCPDFKNCTTPGLKVNKDFLNGLYFFYANIPFYFAEGQKCSYYNFTSKPNNVIGTVKNEWSISTDVLRKTTAEFFIDTDGSLGTNFTELQVPVKYTVVAQTFDYMILMTCNECGFLSKLGSGIGGHAISRFQEPPCDISEAILDKFKQCGIPDEYIQIQNQQDCHQCNPKKKRKYHH
ncbi:hypothetical protein PVAND_015323 [Polypedilum vanderplanki]|uniref:Uncharacterized protein n=1 Tax=Polypedilum vanderplanki TaxID=319348 RepID=A0A9J6BBY4_POLVA|nr:hypothetical protein PVAND_015323 [Polypedilum vanderplanki]